MRTFLKPITCGAIALIAACTDDKSATDLNPAGPPEILQVRLKERFVNTVDSSRDTHRVFAFGSHPQATDGESHHVTNAYAGADATELITPDFCGPDEDLANPCGVTNHIRIIFDREPFTEARRAAAAG